MAQLCKHLRLYSTKNYSHAHLQLDWLTFKSDIAVVAEEFIVSDPDFSSGAGSTEVASTGNTLYHTWIISNSFQNTKKQKCRSQAAQIKLNKAWTITPQSLEANVQRLVDQNATNSEEVFKATTGQWIAEIHQVSKHKADGF